MNDPVQHFNRNEQLTNFCEVGRPFRGAGVGACAPRRPLPYDALASVAFNLASSSSDSEVLSTLGLKGSISGNTLSKVTLLTSTNRADDPGGIVWASRFTKSSLMP